MNKSQARAAAKLFAYRVAPIYQILGWAWAPHNSPPSPHKILANLYDLINQCEPDSSIGTGGLCVTRDGDDFSLEFRIEAYDLPDDEPQS